MSTIDSVLLTIRDESWTPRIVNPSQLADYLRGRQIYAPDESFRVWDIDPEGQPRECEIQSTHSGYDENDWGHVAVRVMRFDTGEFVLGTAYRIDGRM